MAIVNVDENNFEEQILQAGETTLVDFYADWCSHCRTIAPMLDQLSSEKQIRIAKVNVDESPRLAEQYLSRSWRYRLCCCFRTVK